MGYYNDLSLGMPRRPCAERTLPGDKTEDAARHGARVAYARGFAGEWQYRYFVTHAEACRQRHAFRRALYRVVVQCRAADGGWETS